MDYREPEIIQKLGEVLRQPASLSSFEELEVMRFDLSLAIADQMKLVYEKRKQMLWPKDMDKGLTELDRTTRLNGDLAQLERDWEFLKMIEAQVELRLLYLMNRTGRTRTD